MGLSVWNWMSSTLFWVGEHSKIEANMPGASTSMEWSIERSQMELNAFSHENDKAIYHPYLLWKNNGMYEHCLSDNSVSTKYVYTF